MSIGLTTYRVHDASLGSWWQVDPRAEALKGLSPYNAMGNNPVTYSDPNGDFIPQLVGAVVGGVVNLADQALKGNVTSFGEGLAYFGNGALAGVAVSVGQVGLARGITAVGNKGIQFATGKFDPGGIDSWGDVAGLALDVGTDLLSPGLTSAISKPITKSLLARGVANAIDDAVVAGGGNIIKQQLSKEAAEQLAKNSIEFSLTFSDEFVVSASRIGGNKLGTNLATKAVTHIGDDIVGQGVNYHSRVLARKDLYHNFPKMLDEHIIKNGNWSQRLKDRANWFELPGSVNGSKGVYQLGVNGKNTIFHKNFVPF